MKIAFLYPAFEYTPATPLVRPLGGTESAVCYLSQHLAALGHHVSIFNKTDETGIYNGVECSNFFRLLESERRDFDFVICGNASGLSLRDAGFLCPLIFWTGHYVDQPAVEKLRDPAERETWHKFVFISDFQAQAFEKTFLIPKNRKHVLPYGISPGFQDSPERTAFFFEEDRPPILTYSSTPFRGLDILVKAFPKIRAEIPGITAKIFSSMAVYQKSLENDPYRILYEVCRSTDGIEYIGSKGQGELCNLIRTTDVFSYPCTFLETACISLMEAMASELLVVSIDSGALKETAAGFGNLVSWPASNDKDILAEHYANFCIAAISDTFRRKSYYRDLLKRQRAFCLDEYNWTRIAGEWDKFLLETKNSSVESLRLGRNDPCFCGSGKRYKTCHGAYL